MTHEASTELDQLARIYGIVPEGGAVIPGLGEASADTLIAVLAALGVDASNPARVRQALAHAADEPWRRMLPHIVTVVAGCQASWFVHVDDGAAIAIHIELEEGGRHEVVQVDNWDPPRVVDGRSVGRAAYTAAGLPLGWHTIVASSNDITARCPLLVSPARLQLPVGRHWGLMAQLYSLRSQRSWGIGDFADLRDLAWLAGRKLGADFLLINPVHAGEPVAPMTPSPYLPSSRRFRHPLYIRVEDIPETAYMNGPERALIDWHGEPAWELNKSAGAIDRDAVWDAKKAALEVVFKTPRSVARTCDFAEFCQHGGEELRIFATWCALVEHHGSVELPPQYSSPRSAEVAALAATLAERIEFYCWLQWIADEQLALAQRVALDVGMSVGIMHDLAVGVHKFGADAWRLQQVLAHDVSMGSPPDYYNQQGQDWSQPPWNPVELAKAGYGPFRDMVQAVFRHAGAVRVDHVIGMFRMWWIPAGSSPRDGVYVRIDHEAMIGILLLEAQRAGAMVIGEDLGIVEPWVREYLADRGVLGTSVLWFEKDNNGQPIPPQHYRRQTLATVTTHDLPPTASYLAGEHVELRNRLGLLSEPVEWERMRATRERNEVVAMLRVAQLVGDDPSEREIVEALYVYLQSAPSVLMGVALTDAVGERRTQNQPGTDTEYPNWQVPLSDSASHLVMMEDLLANQRLLSLVRALSRTSDNS